MSILIQWTLEAIRNDDPMMGWLEERRFDFVPPVQNAIEQILQGATIILITDRERAWFGSYLTAKINAKSAGRPLLPIVTLDMMCPALDVIESTEDIDMIEDMLSLAYKKYFIWYIGRGDDRRADIAKRHDKNMLWIFDEEVQNSFMLHSYDKLLDIKLLHLYRLFEKTLSGALFGEFQL